MLCQLGLSSLISLSLKVIEGSGGEMKAGETSEVRTEDLLEVRLMNLGWEMPKRYNKLSQQGLCGISFSCYI